MRIAVCDDDQNFCKEMLKYLQDYFKEKKLKQPEYGKRKQMLPLHIHSK